MPEITISAVDLPKLIQDNAPITIYRCDVDGDKLTVSYSTSRTSSPPHDKPILANIEVRQLYGTDLTADFIETLEALSPVGLRPHQLGDIFRRRLISNTKTYVAVNHNKVVGTASLLLDYRFPHNGNIAGHVEDVAVHKSAQGQGVGSLLMGYVMDKARAIGCRKVSLNCVPGLEAFYSRFGFIKRDIFMRADQ